MLGAVGEGHERQHDGHFHEDAQASVTIRRLPSRRGPYLSLELNGVNVAGTSPDLYSIQKLQGHLPLLIAPAARSVVHIGFGSGGTAWAVSRHPVDEVLVVEISPAGEVTRIRGTTTPRHCSPKCPSRIRAQ